MWKPTNVQSKTHKKDQFDICKLHGTGASKTVRPKQRKVKRAANKISANKNGNKERKRENDRGDGI